MKGIAVIQKLNKILPRHSLITIYKSTVRPHLHYDDIIYDQPNSESFPQKIKKIHYNAAFEITGAIKGTSQSKLYSELGFGLSSYALFLNLKQVAYQNICLILFHKTIICTIFVFRKMLQHFTLELTLSNTLFFPSTILEWNKLDRQTKQSSTLLTFRNSPLKIGQLAPKSVYNIHNPNGLKLLTRFRLGLSHLNEHKFNCNFKDCVNPLCSCSLEFELVPHFFLHCHYFTDYSKNPLS